MKISSSLALICIGAILAFAVTATPSFFNLHTAGWVLMLPKIAPLNWASRMPPPRSEGTHQSPVT